LCLLALIADAITGNHAAYINKNIFIPLGLSNTNYRNEKNYINNTNLVDSYWDLLNVSRFVNITPMQKANVASMVGDDGIVCTPADAVKFMRGLMEGKLLQDSSLKIMEQFVKNDEGRPVYGCGLINIQVDSLMGYGHGGGGIGAGCALLYVPQKHTYISLQPM
jgi:D-alanyl-D-alanine carboxypeptidase